jgi:hypothetical protein
MWKVSLFDDAHARLEAHYPDSLEQRGFNGSIRKITGSIAAPSASQNERPPLTTCCSKVPVLPSRLA